MSPRPFLRRTRVVAVGVVTALGGSLALTHDASAEPVAALDPVSAEPLGGALDHDGDKVADVLEATLRSTPDNTDLAVIVRLADGADRADLPDGRPLDVIDSVAVTIPADEVATLAARDDVLGIEPDAEVHAYNGDTAALTGAAAGRSQSGATGDRDGNATGYSPADVVVAIIDTGIDPTHVDLDGGKVIAWNDVRNGVGTPYDDHGHGTHVSATIAGTGEGSSALTGMAPGAALVGVKALDSSGRGRSSDVIAAIDWVVANKGTYDIEIINLSLGFPGCSSGTDAVSLAVDRAVAAGMVVVAAAGNEGPGRCTIGSPAAAASALTVGALSIDSGTGGMTGVYYSSRGPTADGRQKPDVMAPGNVVSADRGTGSGYRERGGTSMAAGVVTGIVALLLDRAPSLTPAQVKDTLRATARDWGSSGGDSEYGAGFADAFAALTLVGGSIGGAPPHPAHGHLEGLLRAGEQLTVPLTVTTAGVPIGVTLLHSYEVAFSSNPDLDITLRAPNGAIAGSARTQVRNEAILVTTSTVGTYQMEITSKNGSSFYFLDVSGPIALSPSAPSTPAVVSSGGQGRTTLAWPPSSGDPVAYTISSDQTGYLATVPATRTSFELGGLVNGQTYVFSVQAQNLTGVSAAGSAIVVPTTYHPFVSPEAFITQQYRDFLLREPDGGGLAYWSGLLRGGISGTLVVSAFLGSEEYEGRIASLARLYFAYFLRAPEVGGLEYWLGQRVNGQSLAWVAGFFAESPEFASRYGSLDDAAFVQLIYRNVLGREPDPEGEAFWVGQLRSRGMSRGIVMLLFSESAEYRATSQGQTDTTLVWFGMLHAIPTADDYGYWVGALANGTSRATLVDLLLHDGRYRARVG